MITAISAGSREFSYCKKIIIITGTDSNHHNFPAFFIYTICMLAWRETGGAFS